MHDRPDPYRVWLSEVMLQQTQVAAVIPYYARFVERFPDVHALAAAPLDDVMHAWSGLGYYSRARNLHAAARAVVDLHGGVFPSTPEALATLPGIGRSTAAAIAAFSFGHRAAILDGNVKRVLARLFAVEGSPNETGVTKRLWSIADSLVPDRDVESYTQGMMDLGATVCVPRNPACMVCPFAEDCEARRQGRTGELPHRRARKALPERRTTMLLVTRDDDVLLERRPPAGIWGGLWSLPETAGDPVVAAARYGDVVSTAIEPGVTHGFTPFVLHATVLRATVRAAPAAGSPAMPMRWVASGDLRDLGLPAPIRTLLSATLDRTP